MASRCAVALRQHLSEDYIPIILVTALDARRDDLVEGWRPEPTTSSPSRCYGAELRARVANLLKVRAYHQLVATQRDSARATVDVLRQQVLQADRLATLGTFAAGVSHELNNIAQVLRERPREARGGEDADGQDHPRHAHRRDPATSPSWRAPSSAWRAPRTGASSRPISGGALEEVRDMLRLTGPHAACAGVARSARGAVRHPRQPGACASRCSSTCSATPADAVADGPSRTSGRRDATARRAHRGLGAGQRPRHVRGGARPHLRALLHHQAPGSGTGLGLPVVKQLVESWGGRILVQSQPGLGTRMVLEVPAALRLAASSSSRSGPTAVNPPSHACFTRSLRLVTDAARAAQCTP